MNEVSLWDVGAALNRGENVAIVVRHAERPPLAEDDPTFGAGLELTDHGRAQADAFGFVLSQYRGNAFCEVYSSVMKRCLQTAEIIRRHFACNSSATVMVDETLGSGSPYFGDVRGRLELAAAGDYHEALNEYFRLGSQRGFNDLDASTREFENHILSSFSESRLQKLSIFVTHDLNIACYLAGTGTVPRFLEYNWPGFMDSAVIFRSLDGSTRYGYMRTLENRTRIDL